MEIIVGHINTDFDCIASMIAAKKIYKNAQMVLHGVVGREVREFTNLYRDTFNFNSIKDINIEEATRVIVVDTHSKSRLGKNFINLLSKPDIDFIVYDHHPPSNDAINGRINIIEKVGANTTLLVEEIQKSNIEISSLESTIFALGIYADTNRLTYQSTTSRDAYAIAYLLSKNVNLQVIESYLNWTLTPLQQEFIKIIDKNTDLLNINGYKVAVAVVETSEYVNESSYLTGKLLEENNYDAYFSIFKMGKTTYIMGRSLVDKINVGKIMSFFKGAGHKGAGSAKTKDDNLNKLYDSLKNVLEKNINPVTKAKEIMSCPVKTVPDTTTIEEANRIILRYGHSGLPVIKEKTLTGIISRRDVEKALLHGFGNSPVKGYMSKDVITIDEDATIKDIQCLLITNNIGRLPVLRGTDIVGIVTRSDIIRILFGESLPKKTYKKCFDTQDTEDIVNLKNKIDFIPVRIKDILYNSGKIADKSGYNLYVVGGFVRDLIMGKNTFDIDMVVEGDAFDFAKKLSNYYGGKVTKHKKFQTAMVKLDNQFFIDIVTARKEYYEYPAALPTVEKGTIKDDLFRRDFTINCMAIKLNSNHFGQLVDFYGGRKDLKNKVIRILYNLSFIEDPTRIIRAVRFEKRYGFKMEKATEEFAINAISSDCFSNVSIERINYEFFAILKEKRPWKIIERMAQLKILNKVYPEIQYNSELKNLLKKCCDNLSQFKNNLNSDKNTDTILLYLLLLHSNMDADKVKVSIEKMRLKRERRNEINRFTKTKNTLKSFDVLDLSNYKAFTLFKELSLESLYVLTLLFCNKNFYNKVLEYINELKDIRLNITGNDLKEMGVVPGPQYKKILDEILKQKINGNVHTLEGEIKLAEILLNNLNNPLYN
ncbi:CBS domain-containing protein [Herbivorax sp. ANBcel31]|uniref:CBS domain-containing protein n=1 Tax=Herbivorax sp. ANBcel31 TaxID=3069754 RepID=UPI0027AE8783|nr:CBS domain-containing protein [Herbivorax sp. ANBcel31]MDQ2085748.1 CBS domain-containing protein [Herbivorax sp. ANBcel31]